MGNGEEIAGIFKNLSDQQSKLRAADPLPLFDFDRPEVWEERINRLGNRIRPFHRYNKEFHGHSPKPNWNITQQATGARSGRFAGAPAKVVWKPPGKTQRVSKRMVNSHSIDYFFDSTRHKYF